jgi:prevent-host-death family protein
MPVVGLRELSRQTGDVIDRVEATGEPVVITKQGRPVAALIAVDGNRLEDLVLSTAPEFASSTAAADRALSEGATRSMSEVLGEMTQEELAQSSPATGAEPAQLIAGYAQLLEQLSVDAVQGALPEGASPETIEALQALNAGYFSEIVLQSVHDAFERVRRSNVNALAAGRESGDLDVSLKLLEGAKAAQQLSYTTVADVTSLANLGVAAGEAFDSSTTAARIAAGTSRRTGYSGAKPARKAAVPRKAKSPRKSSSPQKAAPQT